MLIEMDSLKTNFKLHANLKSLKSKIKSISRYFLCFSQKKTIIFQLTQNPLNLNCIHIKLEKIIFHHKQVDLQGCKTCSKTLHSTCYHNILLSQLTCSLQNMGCQHNFLGPEDPRQQCQHCLVLHCIHCCLYTYSCHHLKALLCQLPECC